MSLELESAEGFALGAKVKLNDERDSEDEGVEEQLHTESIEIHHAGEDGGDRGMCVPSGDGESQAAQQRQVHSAKRAAGEDLRRDGASQRR